MSELWVSGRKIDFNKIELTLYNNLTGCDEEDSTITINNPQKTDKALELINENKFCDLSEVCLYLENIPFTQSSINILES